MEAFYPSGFSDFIICYKHSGRKHVFLLVSELVKWNFTTVPPHKKIEKATIASPYKNSHGLRLEKSTIAPPGKNPFDAHATANVNGGLDRQLCWQPRFISLRVRIDIGVCREIYALTDVAVVVLLL